MPPPDPVLELFRLISTRYEMYRLLLDDYRHGTKTGIQWYKNYIDEIQRIVPKENLLVLNQTEGWAPLCRFLGKDVPGWDYPHVNKTQQTRENSNIIGGYIDQQVHSKMTKTVGAGAAAVIALGLGFAFARRSMS